MEYHLCVNHVVAVRNTFRLPCKTCFRHDIQCFFATTLERGQPRGAIKIDFTSDQWTRFQLRIFQRRWSRDQSHRATRWRQDSCGHLMGHLAHRRCLLRRLLTVLTDTWPPKFNSSRIRADVAKWLLLAHRVISLSHLLIVLQGLPDLGHSSTIPVACNYRMVYLHLPATLIMLRHACDMATACPLSTLVNIA